MSAKIVKKESKEKRFKRLHDIKTWGFDANLQEREEITAIVIKTEMTRKQAVLAALRKYLELHKEDEK